jgi:hypothetical protein
MMMLSTLATVFGVVGAFAMFPQVYMWALKKTHISRQKCLKTIARALLSFPCVYKDDSQK